MNSASAMRGCASVTVKESSPNTHLRGQTGNVVQSAESGLYAEARAAGDV